MKYLLTFTSQKNDYLTCWVDIKEVVVDVPDSLCEKTKLGGFVWHLIGGHPVEDGSNAKTGL